MYIHVELMSMVYTRHFTDLAAKVGRGRRPMSEVEWPGPPTSGADGSEIRPYLCFTTFSMQKNNPFLN